MFEVERRLAADRPAELTLPAPHLHLAYATRFRDDLVAGRVPEDRHELTVDGAPLALRIEPLPVDGQPAGFTGAVGRFTVHATAEPGTVAVGQSLKLAVRVEPTDGANLGSFDAPSLDRLDGFHVLGHIESEAPDHRTITYDLAPLRTDVTAVPAIDFAFFDPTPPGRYRTVHTEPIPITVTGTDDAAVDAPEPKGPTPGVDDIHGLLPFESGDSVPRPALDLGALLAILAAPWLLALAFVAVRRRRARDDGEHHARARRAAVRLRAGPEAHEASLVFADYLAARLRCAEAEVIAPELPRRLAASGIPASLAERATTSLDALLAARYGGHGHGVDPAALGALLDELEAAFAARSTRR